MICLSGCPLAEQEGVQGRSPNPYPPKETPPRARPKRRFDDDDGRFETGTLTMNIETFSRNSKHEYAAASKMAFAASIHFVRPVAPADLLLGVVRC